MRWSKKLQAAGAVIVLLWAALLVSLAEPARQLTVYTPQGSYLVELRDRDGQSYVNIMDLASPLGPATMRVNGNDWKLRFNGTDATFTKGKDKARISGASIDLGGKAASDGNHLLVPFKSASAILGALLRKPTEFHPEARRIFIDNAATRFTAELKKTEKTTLVLSFSQPVHPVITQDDTGVKLLFKREPVLSESASQPFDDKTIHSLSFSEDNGAASLTIAGGPGLNAALSADGKSITIEPAAASAASAQPQPTPSPAAPAIANEAAGMPASGQPHGPPEFFVLIDASHGGNDQGAMLAQKLPEKEITLAMARRLKTELGDRGIAARLLRDSDVGISLEQRAETANGQHAGIYIALHAGAPGEGVRIYAPALTVSPPAAGKFVPWESAQSSYLARSQAVAQAVSTELGKKGLAVSSLSVPLRPLNNITAPAIAIELAASPDKVQDVATQKFQGTIAEGVVAGILRIREHLEAQQ